MHELEKKILSKFVNEVELLGKTIAGVTGRGIVVVPRCVSGKEQI